MYHNISSRGISSDVSHTNRNKETRWKKKCKVSFFLLSVHTSRFVVSHSSWQQLMVGVGRFDFYMTMPTIKVGFGILTSVTEKKRRKVCGNPAVGRTVVYLEWGIWMKGNKKKTTKNQRGEQRLKGGKKYCVLVSATICGCIKRIFSSS